MNAIKTIDQLNDALADTAKGVFIFKHSTTCPISARANANVVDFLKDADESTPPFHLIKVIESRKASNETASRLGVTHESPQLILVKEGKAVWHASHGAINANAITGAIEKHTENG